MLALYAVQAASVVKAVYGVVLPPSLSVSLLKSRLALRSHGWLLMPKIAEYTGKLLLNDP